MKNATLSGKPYAGKQHVRFDEGEVASTATPRRGSLLYKKQVIGVFAILTAVSAFAAAKYYTGPDGGDWHVDGNWYPANVPTISDPIIFGNGLQKTDLTVHLRGKDAWGFYLYAWEVDSGSKVNDGTWTNIVTLLGEGATLTLDGTQNGQLSVNQRRKLVLDNITIKDFGDGGGGGGFAASGWSILRNGTKVIGSPEKSTYLNAAKGAIVEMDDSSISVDTFAMSPGSSISLRHGSSLTFNRHYMTESQLAGINAEVIDGDVLCGSFLIATTGFLPQRSGTLSGKSFYPVCASDGSSAYRLGGSLMITNQTDTGLYITNSIVFYGDGKIFEGLMSAPDGRSDIACTLDVSEFRARASVMNVGKLVFGDNIVIGSLLGGLPLFYSCDLTGRTSVDTAYPDGGVMQSGSSMTASFLPGSALSVYGGGMFRVAPGFRADSIAELTVGAGTTLKIPLSYFARMKTHDFRLAKGAVIDMTASGGVNSSYNRINAIGKVEIDPEATIKLINTGAGVSPLITALDEITPPKFVFSSDETPEILHVGGCYYAAYSPSISRNWYTWNGTKGGSWSDSNNWQSHKPDATHGAVLEGLAGLGGMVSSVVTNDVEGGVTTPFIYAYNTAGPFIIRGNKLTLTSSDVNVYGGRTYTVGVETSSGSAICSQSLFPLIIEAPIEGTGERFCVLAGGNGYETTCICLRGDVNVPNGEFVPSGDVVVDGKVTAKDLAFAERLPAACSSGSLGAWNTTVLTIRDGGEVEITNPTVSQTNGTVWIAQGGKLTINGDFSWTDVAKVHKVDGTLAVACKLKGTGVETYYGKGSVEVAGIAAGTTAKFGQGITLAPTDATAANWAGVIAVDGKMKFAPADDWALPANVSVVRPGSVLEFAGSGRTVLSAAPTGADYDISVSGKLVIANDVTVPYAKFAAGATLAFARKGDGTIPTLTVNGDVDLTGVTLTGCTDEDADAMYKTVVLKVPHGCRITGVPAQTDHFKFAVFEDDDGGQSLVASRRKGLLIILR